jgi:tetratricopeptide (TPR) repeat protein
MTRHPLKTARLPLFSLCLAARLAGAETPAPWDAYNAGVQAYAARDYAAALEHWENLSLQPLPRGLRRPVWFQLGNVHFRRGEQLEAGAPEQTVELWRRSVDAYQSALAAQPRDPAARHNLALVRLRLTRVLHRLGLEAFGAAEGRPADEAVNRLRDATASLDEAVTHAPEDAQIRADRDRVEKAFRERLLARAADAEQRGDEDAKARNTWSDWQAEARYREALGDIAEASPPAASDAAAPRPAGPHNPEAEVGQAGRAALRPTSVSGLDQTAAEAHERVSQKLADLLTRMGRREQQEGQAQSEWNPDEALGHFEAALQNFERAQAERPGHETAARGEREVRRAMEQLHLREGRDALRQGREQLARQSAQSAPTLGTALGHFEAALGLNPLNGVAEAGAAEARKLLPEALTLAGQAQMQAGERAETYSASSALAHYQEAESDFQQALALQPGQAQAERGLAEVEPRLARLRERVADEARQAAQQSARPGRQLPTLESLLDQVSGRDRPLNPERQRQPGRNRPGERRNPRDW